MSAASNSIGRIFFRIGMSLSRSCSCRLIVCVEMTAFFFCPDREKDRRREIGERFADAGPGFDHEVALLLQGARHGHRHLLLLGPILEVLRLREQAVPGKKGPDLFDKVAAEGISEARSCGGN